MAATRATTRQWDDKRCFLHIPKSGGTSIHVALEAALTPDLLSPRRMDTSAFCGFSEFDLLQPTTRQLIATDDREIVMMGKHRFVSGHFALPGLLKIAPAKAIGTIMREPRTRLLSLYLYWRTPHIFDNLLPYNLERYALMPLDHFLAEPRLAPASDNQICRLLLYGDPRIPSNDFIAQSDIAAIASDATQQLATLGFVGVLELRETVWQGLERHLGVSLEPRRANIAGELGNPAPASPGEAIISTDAFDLLARRNAADSIIYDYALRLSGVQDDERLHSVESTFAEHVARLERILSCPVERAASAK
jgi:hypothetical protein